MNLTLVLDIEQPGRIHTRLASALRSAILEGQVSAGEALPSSRALARSLGVARGTVVSVYEDLAGEGYVTLVPGSGTFASHNIDRQALTGQRALPPLEESAVSESGGSGRDLLEMSPGLPSTQNLPSKEWSAVWREIARSPVPSTMPDPAGFLPLREQIAEHLLRARGLSCGPDDIIITAGTAEAMSLLALTLRATGHDGFSFGCENPGHVGTRAVLNRFGATVVPLPVRDGGIDLAALRNSSVPLTGVIVTPSHQYPLGGSLDVGRRLDLLRWAATSGAVVIEDDYDGEFRYESSALPTLASLDTAGNVVHIGTFSKTLSPWERCGYIVARGPRLNAAISAVRADVGQPVSGTIQQALARYLEPGGLKRHIARTRREYNHKRQLLRRELAEISQRATVTATEGGLHAVVRRPREVGRPDLVTELRSAGMRVANLDDYYISGTASSLDGIVFGYGACTDLELVEFVRVLRALL